MYILLFKEGHKTFSQTQQSVAQMVEDVETFNMSCCMIYFLVTAAWNGATTLSNCNLIGILAENTTLHDAWTYVHLYDDVIKTPWTLIITSWISTECCFTTDWMWACLWVQKSHFFVSFIQGSSVCSTIICAPSSVTGSDSTSTVFVQNIRKAILWLREERKGEWRKKEVDE